MGKKERQSERREGELRSETVGEEREGQSEKRWKEQNERREE